jgi:nucleotide-binding universal stress UspA family protein
VDPDVALAAFVEPRGRIRTVLLATDLTQASSAATEQAIDLSIQLGARLLIVNVMDPGRGGLLRHREPIRPVEERRDRAEVAQEIAERARTSGAEATFLVWEGDVGDGILAAAEAEHADLIVVGSRGRSGVERSLLGSVSDRIVRRAPCPVLVVRPDQDDGGTDPARSEPPTSLH